MTSGSPTRVASRPFGLMRPLRRELSAAVIVGIFGLHAVVLWRDKEIWPFSQYPMYSWLEPGPTLSVFRLMGVPEGSPEREIPIQEEKYILPFDQARLFDAFALMQKDPDASTRTATALRDVFDRYELRRKREEHAGPRLVSMRLYEVHYELLPDASNVDRPERSHLVAEVR